MTWAVLGLVRDLCRVEECLGGYASVVEAGASHLGLFDESNGHTEFGGAKGGGVATGASAEDEDIKRAGG